MIRLYDQNIWGNMPKTESVANRNCLIYTLIQECQPDFCTFQECNPDTSRQGEDAMQEILKDTYAEAAPEEWNRNFTPVFYRRDRWELIDSGFMPYEGLNDINSKSITWAILKEIATGKSVCIISTHFWWQYQSEKDTRQRLENVAALKKLCDEIIEKYNVPVIVAGDLNNGANAVQGELPYKTMLTQGFQDIRTVAPKTTDCHTCHKYPVRNEQGDYVGTSLPAVTIDYILTYGEKPLQAECFQVLTDTRALSSSDHCPLVGNFAF